MTDLSVLDNVADAFTRLRFLETKSADDDALLNLLMSQKDALAQELADVKHNTEVEIHQMKQERDAALKVAHEVSLVIEALGNMAVSGLRKVKAYEEPEVQKPSDPPPTIVKHLQPSYRGLPEVTPDTALPDKPTFLDRPRDRERELPISAGDKRLGGLRT